MTDIHTRIYAAISTGDSVAALDLLGEAQEALTAAEAEGDTLRRLVGEGCETARRLRFALAAEGRREGGLRDQLAHALRQAPDFDDDPDDLSTPTLVADVCCRLMEQRARLTRIEAAARLCGQHNYATARCPVTAALEEGT